MELAINGGKPCITEPIKELWKDIKESDAKKVYNYILNNELSVIDGGILKEFEDKFAKFIGVRYAVAYCNGTAALHAASYACGAKKNTKFILSEYSYHGTVNSVLENRANVCLCNYDKKTLNIDLKDAEKNIDADTIALIITHCWGNPVDMDKVEELRKKYNLKVISDASHAHGATWRGKKIGALECEDVACFSLGKNKLISAGELGVAVTNNPEIYDKLLFMGHPNRVPNGLITEKYKGYINGIGNKYRPHSLSMVIALEQLDRYGKKKELNQNTNNQLSNEINKISGFKTIKSYQNSQRVFWKLLIELDMNYWAGININKIVKALEAEGLKLEQHHNYNIVENEKIWKYDRYKNQLKNKSTLKEPTNIIILPGYIELSVDDKTNIIKILEKVSNNKEELR